MLAKSLVKTGKEQEARKMLEQLHRTAEEEFVTPFSFMLIYASLEEMDKAFSYLDQCFEERTNWLIGLNLPAYYEDLRSNPRFEEYVERMNFPE